MIVAYARDGETYIQREGAATPVRVLCSPCQLELIVGFRRQGRPVELCSVNVVNPEAYQDPRQLLTSLREASQPDVAGGPRPLRGAESVALCLGAVSLEAVVIAPHGAVPLFVDHPAVRAGLTFSHAGLMTIPLLLLLREIYDIRRLADPARPQAHARMRNYFRLSDTRTIARLCSGPAPKTLSQARTQLAVWAWLQQPFEDTERERIEADPRAFLFRDRYRYAEQYRQHANDAEALVRALWRVTNRFLLYLRLLWRAGLGDLTFDPYRFFTRKDEADSFQKFINSVDKGLDNSA